MALPTKADLLTMDFDFKGEPFVWVEAKALGTLSMDYDFKGEPFAVAAVEAAGAGFFSRYYYDMIGQSYA